MLQPRDCPATPLKPFSLCQQLPKTQIRGRSLVFIFSWTFPHCWTFLGTLICLTLTRFLFLGAPQNVSSLVFAWTLSPNARVHRLVPSPGCFALRLIAGDSPFVMLALQLSAGDPQIQTNSVYILPSFKFMYLILWSTLITNQVSPWCFNSACPRGNSSRPTSPVLSGSLSGSVIHKAPRAGALIILGYHSPLSSPYSMNL